MIFPAIVYKTPGAHDYEGGTFEYLGVKNEEELSHAIKNGWFLSLPEAIKGVHDLSSIDNQPTTTLVSEPKIPHVADPIIGQFDKVILPGKGEGYGQDAPLDKSGGIPIDQPGGAPENTAEATESGDPVSGFNDETVDSTVLTDDTGTEGDSDTSLQGGLTRAELKAKASELGIDYDGRISNAKLAQLIADRENGV